MKSASKIAKENSFKIEWCGITIVGTGHFVEPPTDIDIRAALFVQFGMSEDSLFFPDWGFKEIFEKHSITKIIMRYDDEVKFWKVVTPRKFIHKLLHDLSFNEFYPQINYTDQGIKLLGYIVKESEEDGRVLIVHIESKSKWIFNEAQNAANFFIAAIKANEEIKF